LAATVRLGAGLVGGPVIPTLYRILLVYHALVAFFSGAIVEGLYAVGVRLIGKRRPIWAAISSMAWISFILLGGGEVVHAGMPAAVALVLGYGVGCYVVTTWDFKESK
jgi:hypothetical protein